jgi:hypothetical protein
MTITIYIRCLYGIYGRQITKYTVIYGSQTLLPAGWEEFLAVPGVGWSARHRPCSLLLARQACAAAVASPVHTVAAGGPGTEALERLGGPSLDQPAIAHRKGRRGEGHYLFHTPWLICTSSGVPRRGCDQRCTRIHSAHSRCGKE